MPANLNQFYLHGGINTSLEIASTGNDEIVVPEKCMLDSIVVSVTVALTSDTLLTLIVNGSSTTTTANIPGTLAADSGLVLQFNQFQRFFAADRVSLQSDGATADATAAHFQWIMRR